MTRAPLLALLLTACATTQAPEPVIRTVEVRVPVDDPRCAREAVQRLDADRPAYPDTDEALRAAANAFEGARLLVAGRILRIAREAMLEASILAQNVAVETARAAGEARAAGLERSLSEARAATQTAQSRAAAVLARRPGPDQCADALATMRGE